MRECRRWLPPGRSGEVVPSASPCFLFLVDAETSALPADYVTNAMRASALDVPDRIGAIPTGRHFSDVLEESALAATDVGYFDHGTGMGLRVEIGEAALFAADLALMSHLVAKRQRPVVELLVFPAPIRHVLQAFAAAIEKFLVHRGRIVALLDQLDLEIAGIGERDAHLHGGVFAAVAEVIGLDPIDIVP